MSLRRLMILTLFAAAGSGATDTGALLAQTINDPRVRVEVAAEGLTQPIAMTFLGNTGWFLVAQKADGKVLQFSSGATTGTVVLDLAVNSAGERGLLGIATDPSFAFTLYRPYVYLYYSESSTGSDTSDPISIPLGNRVYRYSWDLNTLQRLIDPRLILDLPATPGPNHDGGVLAFGPDDMLYAVIGDLNRNGKLQNNPEGGDPDDTGAILRIDTTGQPAGGNPFYDVDPGNASMSRIYAYGVRNSFGLAFDPVTRALWDTENGPDAYDEVNLVIRGFNSGWNRIMGPDSRDPEGPEDLWSAPGSTYRDPEFSWTVPVAPTALSFVVSRKLGCGLEHDLLVGDANCGNLYRFTPNAARDGLTFTSAGLLDRVADNNSLPCFEEMSEILYGGGFGIVTDMKTGVDGSLYLVSLSHGRIYRIVPNTGAFPDADGDSVDDSCDCAPFDRLAFAPTTEVPRTRILSPFFSGEGSGTGLAWDLQSATAGGGTRTTIVSGDLDALRYGGGFSRACLLGSSLLSPPFNDTRTDPSPGYGHYYLIRAGNSCGPGTYGRGIGRPEAREALDAATALPACSLCSGRAGGAYITFDIGGESLRVWITNGPFIDQALQELTDPTGDVAIFNTLLDGRDCDPQWTWHPDPFDVVWAPAAVEVCDGRPSDVEFDKPYWFRIGFCPWSLAVTAVDDQR